MPFIPSVPVCLQSCTYVTKPSTFKCLLNPPPTRMKGLSACPQISWLATGIIWVSPLCVGACLWAGQLKGMGGWPFCVLLLISWEAAPLAWLKRSRAFGSDRWRAGSFSECIEHTHPTVRLAWPQPLLWELTLVWSLIGSWGTVSLFFVFFFFNGWGRWKEVL